MRILENTADQATVCPLADDADEITGLHSAWGAYRVVDG